MLFVVQVLPYIIGLSQIAFTEFGVAQVLLTLPEHKEENDYENDERKDENEHF